MAGITFKAGEEYAAKLSRLGEKGEEIAKKAVYEGAGIVADQIRGNLQKVISGESTGDLERSLGITPIQLDADGMWNAKIGFDGYDSKGVPNQLKARVMESGSSKRKARPFVRPAVNATRAKARAAMERVVHEEINKIMKG